MEPAVRLQALACEMQVPGRTGGWNGTLLATDAVLLQGCPPQHARGSAGLSPAPRAGGVQRRGSQALRGPPPAPQATSMRPMMLRWISELPS
jgi:hypothetical protein